MAVPFLTSITLNKNEVQNFKIFNLGTSDPGDLTSGGDLGYFWLNTASPLTLKWWDGANIRSVLDTSSSISGSQISGNISGNAAAATNLLGGDAGKIVYQSAANTSAFVAAGTSSQVLLSGGTGSPTWANQSSLSVGSATSATTSTNLAGGTVGQIAYQSAAGTTAFLSAGTSGQLLKSAGAAAPAWVNRDTIKLSELGSPSADLDLNGYAITNLKDPASDQDAATKKYVDTTAQGLDAKASVKYGTVSSLSAISAYTVSGDKLTITFNTNQAISAYAAAIDNKTPSVNDRLLVKSESAAANNGIWYVYDAGSVSTPVILKRTSDALTIASLASAFVFVEQGDTLSDSGWVCTVDTTGTLGTTVIPWVQFSQAGSYTANRGLVLSGGAFNFAQNSDYTAGQISFAKDADEMTFSSNLNWDNSNSRLGICTASPGQALDVNGNAAAWNFYTLATASSVGAESSNATFQFFGSTGSGGTTNTVKLLTAGSERLTIGSTGIFTWTNVGGVAGTAMTLNSTGLGIGTGPSYKLHILAPNDSTARNVLETTTGYNIFWSKNTSGGTWVATEGSAGATLMAGIPAYSSVVTSIGANPICFGTNTTERMRLDSAGNLGIGETSPSAKLHVAGAATTVGLKVYGGGNSGINICEFGGSGGSASPFFTIAYNAAAYFLGNVGIGASPTAKLDVFGTFGTSTPYAVYRNNSSPSNSNIVEAQYFVSNNNSGLDCIAKFGATNPAATGNNYGNFYWQVANAGSPATAMTLDYRGNLGLGVAPSSWGSAFKAIQIGNTGTLFSRASGSTVTLALASNLYNNGTKNLYIVNGYSNYHEFDNLGRFVWYRSTSGTAGDEITLIQEMTLDASGNLVIGAASAAARVDSSPADGAAAYAVRNWPIIRNEPGGSGIDFGGYTASQWNKIRFYANGSLALTIASTGAATFAGTVTAKSTGTATGQVGVKYTSALAASGTGTTVTLTHNLGTSDLVATLRQISTKKVVYADITFNDDNNVNITFASTQTLSDFQITLVG